MSITEATTGRWSRKIADTILGACNGRENEYVLERWAYVPGMLLMAMARAGVQLAEPEYLSFMTRHMDSFIREDGSIRSYTLEEYNLDQINQGKNLFRLYQQTGETRYAEAAHLLAAQLIGHPRTSEGGFWHKKVYPFQMWLDGLYMASPFLRNTAKFFSALN